MHTSVEYFRYCGHLIVREIIVTERHEYFHVAYTVEAPTGGLHQHVAGDDSMDMQHAVYIAYEFSTGDRYVDDFLCDLHLNAADDNWQVYVNDFKL